MSSKAWDIYSRMGTKFEEKIHFLIFLELKMIKNN
jgi:hypothetical protein